MTVVVVDDVGFVYLGCIGVVYETLPPPHTQEEPYYSPASLPRLPKKKKNILPTPVYTYPDR